MVENASVLIWAERMPWLVGHSRRGEGDGEGTERGDGAGSGKSRVSARHTRMIQGRRLEMGRELK